MDQLDSFIEAAASLASGPNPPASKELFAAILRERLTAADSYGVDGLAAEIAAFSRAPARG